VESKNRDSVIGDKIRGIRMEI